MQAEEEGGRDQPVPKSDLLLPTAEIQWSQVYTEEQRSKDPKFPQLGLGFELKRQHFQELDGVVEPSHRRMPLLQISDSAAHPAILRHLQVNFVSVAISREPTAETPLWFCLVLSVPGRPPLKLVENVDLGLCTLGSLSFPPLAEDAPTPEPLPLGEVVLPAGSLLELHTDSAVIDIHVEIALYASGVLN